MIVHVHTIYVYMYILPHLSSHVQDGRSALILAARWGYTEVVVELVKARANLELQDEVCLDS